MNRARPSNKQIVFAVALLVVLLVTHFLFTFDQQFQNFLQARLPSELPQTSLLSAQSLIRMLKLFMLGLLGYLFIRALNSLIFGLAFRLRKGFEAPTLVRNIFSIAAFTVVFFIIFSQIYPEVPLGSLFTTSAIFGVILGLALQDTLGNFFAGVSLQADRPFQVGDVITVSQKYTGVIEEISWRSITIRTFQNHLVEINNSTVAKEPIEVCPRGNLNARLVFFNTLYTDSPAKTIHVVREAVREAENVSEKITPIVRIRNLGDNGVDYEVKYWLNDYAKYNDTDALVRQRIWYAFRRAGLNFAFPTRTIHVERKFRTGSLEGDNAAIIERLSAVDVFAPLSAEETAVLAKAAMSHVFAPGEMVIRAGDPGSSMFVVHNGKVCVQLNENGRQRTVATLNDGDFFGEMALFTGEPRAANVVALEETEVLEIGHDAMKILFDTNPDLVDALGYIIAERRLGLAARADSIHPEDDQSAGILSAIKRFFKLK